MLNPLDRMKTALDGASTALSGALLFAAENLDEMRANQQELAGLLGMIAQVARRENIVYPPPPAELLAPPPFEVTAAQLEAATKQVHADWLAACQRTARDPSVTTGFRTITDYLEEWLLEAKNDDRFQVQPWPEGQYLGH